MSEQLPFLEETKSGVRLRVQVQPNAPKSQIIGTHDSKLKIKIKSPPVDGKANAALEEFIAELFGIAKSKVSVVKGQTSKLKTLEVNGISLSEAEKFFDTNVRNARQ